MGVRSWGNNVDVCMIIWVDCGLKCWLVNKGLREIGLEEGVDCLLSGGRTYVIILRVRMEVVQAGLMMGWGRRIGNCENTSFWSDPWLENGVLQDRFRRLFKLTVDPNVSVAAMKMDAWVVGGGEEECLLRRKNN